MSPFLTSALQLVTVAAASPTDDTRAHEIFWDACVEGRAEFQAGEVSAVEWSDLPASIRYWYSGIEDELQAYRIVNAHDLYLIHYNRSDPRGNEYSEGCAVIGTELSLRDAEVFVRANLGVRGTQVARCGGEDRLRCRGGVYFDLYPEDFSFRVMGRNLRGDYVAMQLSHIPERVRAHHRIAVSRR